MEGTEMKAILKFNLPDDQYEYTQAINGSKYATTLTEIWNEFRNKEKYSETQTTTWEEARQIVIDIFNENNINQDNL